MKKLSILWLLCLLAVVSAAPTQAQDVEKKPLLATFGDETGLFSLQYPAQLIVFGSGVVESAVLPVPNVVIVSSHSMVLRLATAGAPPSRLETGDWGMAVVFFPKAMFAQMGVAADAPILEVAKAWAQMFLDAERANFRPDPVSLASGADAIVITGRAEDNVEDQYLMLHEVTDGVIALTTIVSAVDGRTPEMEAMHLALTNSIKFTGKAEDILAMMTPPKQ
jgi:hypothetical protein